jgi:L-fuculose-phosphate aldolase
VSENNEQALREQIVIAARCMNAKGINQGTSGNISVRCGDDILITPTSLDYDLMGPDDIVKMRPDGRAEGRLRQSSEWPFHRDLMARRPDFNALSIMGRGIPAIHYMIAVFGGPDIRCSPYATFGSDELSRHAVTAIEGRKACLLGHHGMIVGGDSLTQAMWLAEELETLANQYVICLQLGEPPLLPDAEIENVIRKIKGGYGAAT